MILSQLFPSSILTTYQLSSILLLVAHLFFSPPGDRFKRGFFTNILYAFLFSLSYLYAVLIVAYLISLS